MSIEEPIGYFRIDKRVIPLVVVDMDRKFDNKPTGLLLRVKLKEDERKKYFNNFKNWWRFDSDFNTEKDVYFEFRKNDVISILEKLKVKKDCYMLKNWKGKVENMIAEKVSEVL